MSCPLKNWTSSNDFSANGGSIHGDEEKNVYDRDGDGERELGLFARLNELDKIELDGKVGVGR